MAEKKTAAAVKLIPETYYQIVSKQSGKAIEASDNDAVYMNEPTGGENQQFRFEAVEGGWRIVSRTTGKALDIILAGTENGAQIHQWDVTGADNQHWTVEKASRGCVVIKSKLSGRCLDIVGMSLEAGARIQIWDDMQGDNQQWKLKAVNAPAKKAPAKKAAEKAPARKAAAAKKPAANKTAAKKPAAGKRASSAKTEQK